MESELASGRQGVWRSLDNGGTWTQIKTALNPLVNTDRAQFSLGKLPAFSARMYVGMTARFYRTNDAAGAATFTDMTTQQNSRYCTGQCRYDNSCLFARGRPNMIL